MNASFQAEQSSTSQERQLLSDEIDDMQDANVVGSLQHQIDQLAAAAPNNHYHDVPAHTHVVSNHYHSLNPAQVGASTYIQTGGNTTTSQSVTNTGASALAQTSGPAGSTAVGHQHVHTHIPSDIPHTHTTGTHSHVQNAGNLPGTYRTTNYSNDPASAGTTSGAQ